MGHMLSAAQVIVFQHPTGTPAHTLLAPMPRAPAPTLRSMVAHELSWCMDHSFMRQSSPPDSSRAGSAWGREATGRKRMEPKGVRYRAHTTASVPVEGKMPLACPLHNPALWQDPAPMNVRYNATFSPARPHNSAAHDGQESA